MSEEKPSGILFWASFFANALGLALAAVFTPKSHAVIRTSADDVTVSPARDLFKRLEPLTRRDSASLVYDAELDREAQALSDELRQVDRAAGAGRC